MSFAFIFPGQGSQSVGMLADLAEAFAVVGETFIEASDALGYDLWKRVQEGPDSELNHTTCTQPAMLAAGVSVWRAWQARGGASPVMMAGHSLGEYSALVCSGALNFSDAIKLVAERGRLMQEVVPEGVGAMAAVLGLDDDSVRALCAEAAQGEVCSAVNFNSPGQVVVAGHDAAVERAMALAKEKGARRTLKLPVSVPSHCDLMRPAAEKLAGKLVNVSINTPTIPVLHNVDVGSHNEADAIRQALAQQLYRPVRWVETIQAMYGQGVDTVVEAGPGKVLAGLNKRIAKTMKALPVFDADTLDKALAEIEGA